MSRHAGVWLAGFVLLAIIARVGVITYTRAPHAAAEENRLIARNLQAGRGFTFTEFGLTGPTAVRGPAYPFLLALIGPDRLWLILTINVLAGAGTVLAAYSLTKRLTLLSPLPEYRETGPERAALIAAACFAVWPTQVYAASLTQGLAIAVLLLLSSLALAWRKTPGASIAAGVLAGLAALTEPVLALPLLLSAVVLGWRKNWPNAAVFVAVGCVTVAPWLYRNAIVFGRPMPITSNFWRDAFLGNGPDHSAERYGPGSMMNADTPKAKPKTRIECLPPPEYDRLKVSEVKRVDVFKQWTNEWITTDPAGYLTLCLDRMVLQSTGRFRGFSGIENYYPILRWLLGVWFVIAIWRGAQHGPYFGAWVAIYFGVQLAAAFSLAEPRNCVFLDVADLLAFAIVLGTWAKTPKVIES